MLLCFRSPGVATSGSVVVAIGGDSSGATASVEFQSMQDFCVSHDPGFCPTSRPLRYPGSPAAAVAWYDAAHREDVGLLDALDPLARQADEIGQKIDALGPITPGSPQDTEYEKLRNELSRVQSREWPHWCRHQELGIQSAQVFVRAQRRGWLRDSAIYRAERRWYNDVREHVYRLIHAYVGMPAHNVAADGPPFPDVQSQTRPRGPDAQANPNDDHHPRGRTSGS